jgi:D-glycero-alpha-D-manno-heptose 1-phosphate guanylyltransferase
LRTALRPSPAKKCEAGRKGFWATGPLRLGLFGKGKLPQVTAAILAGGLGTRLRSAIGDLPKPLAPVHNKPYLSYLLDALADASVRDVVLLTGYQADQIYRALGDSYRGMRLVYSPEPTPLGTGGAVRHALPRLASSEILLMNGDSFCEVDLADFWDFHCLKAADLSLVLTHTADTSRFGLVEVAGSGRVKRFGEKGKHRPRGWINAGIYLMSRALIEDIPAGVTVSLERELIPSWLKRGARVFGHRRGGRFIDIGTPDSFAEVEAFFRHST